MTTADLIRRRVAKMAPGSYIRASDFADQPSNAVHSALSRVARSSPDVIRVRNGLYWKGVSSRFGPGQPDLLASAIAVAGAGAGPAGVSAAHALGLTSQVAAHPLVAVLGPRPSGLAGASFTSRSNLARHRLRPLEIAVLEVLRTFPQHVDGSWTDVVKRLATLSDRRDIRIAQVHLVARLEKKPQLRQLADKLRSDLTTHVGGGES
jgi:hypothetical protein